MGSENNNKKKSRKKKPMYYLVYLSQLGISMVTPIIIFLVVGNWLDNWLGTEPWFLAVLTLLGIVVAFTSLYNLVMKDKNRK